MTHTRGATAENAEVFARRIWKVDTERARRDEVTTFLPMPLLWSSSGGVTTIRIPSGVFRHCDLAFLSAIGQPATKMVLTTVVQPFGVGTDAVSASELPPGIYDIEVVLSADNVRPSRATWRIEFSPEWSDDESVMLETVRITPRP